MGDSERRDDEPRRESTTEAENARSFFSGYLRKRHEDGVPGNSSPTSVLAASKDTLYSPGRVEQFYRFGERIGQGGMGKIFLATDRRDGSQWAIKSVSTRGLAKSRANDELWLLEREIAVMRNYGTHRGLVELKEAFRGTHSIYMVIEYCFGGNLYKYLRFKGFLKEIRAVDVTSQIVRALSYLHTTCKFVHRDVKSENVLFVNSSTLQVKLADFGLCCAIDEVEEFSGSCVVGTTVYMSPEILKRQKSDFKVDVWSVGVLAFEMLSGRLPFQGKTESHTEQLIVRNQLSFDDPRWDSVSAEARTFVSACLTYEPSARPSMDSLHSFAWLDNWVQRQQRMKTSSRMLQRTSELESIRGGAQAGGAAPQTITVAELLALHKQRQFKRVQLLLFSVDAKTRKEFKAQLRQLNPKAPQTMNTATQTMNTATAVTVGAAKLKKRRARAAAKKKAAAKPGKTALKSADSESLSESDRHNEAESDEEVHDDEDEAYVDDDDDDVSDDDPSASDSGSSSDLDYVIDKEEGEDAGPMSPKGMRRRRMKRRRKPFTPSSSSTALVSDEQEAAAAAATTTTTTATSKSATPVSTAQTPPRMPQPSMLEPRERTSDLSSSDLAFNMRSGVYSRAAPGPQVSFVDADAHTIEWQRDEHAAACQSCDQSFSLLRRRHHCRWCGLVYCDTCCKARVRLPTPVVVLFDGLLDSRIEAGQNVRVCEDCNAKLEEPPTAAVPSSPHASERDILVARRHQLSQDLAAISARIAELDAIAAEERASRASRPKVE